MGLKQSINQKVDSSDTKKDYFASAKFVDRHAANTARDDRNTLPLFSIPPYFFYLFHFF
ncbi:hypothetical protein [Helicobacter zhangjianzhongii]|uniref:Uncharacterized protein n=1 Tax=Helicobacter zhangjianzhongii TaxID=2974574 RepID=A0ACC6FTL0_9HELI|nr:MULTISPECIES: hypothetical protein [unclassified Helicobacter]MDL0080194.1 hypothetical protein [Helicobacter sp. CPD2-1]MDL0082255.1 hypothetical protein [Helicobacter sp. XJK30-2]